MYVCIFKFRDEVGVSLMCVCMCGVCGEIGVCVRGVCAWCVHMCGV